MNDQPVEHSPIVDQAALVRAIGLNPDFVVRDSVTFGISPNGVPYVECRIHMPVAPTQIGAAFFAGTMPLAADGADGESEPLEQRPTPLDRKRATKKTAPTKKAVARKRTT